MKVNVADVIAYKTEGPTRYFAMVVDEAGELHHTESYASAGGVGAFKFVLEEIMQRWPESDRKGAGRALVYAHMMNMSRGEDSSGAAYPREYGTERNGASQP